jgi:hypothetical protein
MNTVIEVNNISPPGSPAANMATPPSNVAPESASPLLLQPHNAPIAEYMDVVIHALEDHGLSERELVRNLRVEERQLVLEEASGVWRSFSTGWEVLYYRGTHRLIIGQ